MRPGEEALTLYWEAMKAIKVRNYDAAERIAKEMWIPSDAKLVREKIEKAKQAD